MRLNNLDLNKLHAFGAVVEHGGVSGAAAQLGRTPSAVSQSVSGLEGSLGVKLFDRIGRRLVLTRGGEQLYGHLREHHAALQRTVDALVNAGGEVRGEVRIGVYLGFPRQRLATFLARFAARHPLARLRVVYAPQEDLQARLLRNRLDFALALRPTREGDARLESTQLFEEALVLVGGRRFFRRGFSLAELARTPVVDYYQSDPLIARWLSHHFAAGVAVPPVAIWAATTDLVLDLVLSHAGVGVLPRDVAAPYVKQRRLTVLRGRRPALTDFIWLNEVRGAYLDRTLTVFREAVLRAFA
ncbi:MAG: LysR family transcriptional regulator [Candidatus Binatia bacterium]